MKVIDFDKGLETKVTPNPDGTTITTYSFKEIEPRNSCKNHQGVVNIEGTIYEWHEDCTCLK